MQNGGGSYLDKRRGIVRDDWHECDNTPCTCDRKTRRLVKKKWRQKDKKIIREQLRDLGL